jgi:hypothetical protein
MNFWKCKRKTKFEKILKGIGPILAHGLGVVAWPMAKTACAGRAHGMSRRAPNRGHHVWCGHRRWSGRRGVDVVVRAPRRQGHTTGQGNEEGGTPAR